MEISASETQIRLQSEYALLRQLESSYSQHLALSASPDFRQYKIAIHGVRGPVRDGDGYRIVDTHQLTITLPDGFPTERPLLRFSTAILVPNCFTSGVPCLVQHIWHSNMHLDQVVCDAIELVQGVNINWDSVANHDVAGLWRDPQSLSRLQAAIGTPIVMVPLPVGITTRRSGIRSLTDVPPPKAARIRSIATSGQPHTIRTI